jgi:hypothetical protein
MLLRIFTLLTFIISLVVPAIPSTFASEIIFDNPTFWEISATAVNWWGLLYGQDIAWND